MKPVDWDELLMLAPADRSSTISLVDDTFAIKLTGGRYDGSICKLTKFSTYKSEYLYKTSFISLSRLNPNVARLSAINFKFNGRAQQIQTWNGMFNTFKGGDITLYRGFTGENTCKTQDLVPKDVFGSVYEPGKIVSYKRDNKQIFATVVKVDELGRIQLKRIYNQSKHQKFDYISYRMAEENLIIDKNLLDQLMLIRLKSE